MKTILMTGGSGILGREILRINKDFIIHAPLHVDMDVQNIVEIERLMDKFKPDLFLHCAGLTRPMIKHDQNPEQSIRQNIIGTSNVVLSCIKSRTKVIYISTDYVYSGVEGNHTEESNLNPVNKYAWSKLGGECAVRLYDNSLILRISFMEKPFRHDKAFIDSFKSFLYVDEIVPLILNVIHKDIKGILNIGGSRKSVYEFARITNPSVGMVNRHEVGPWVPYDTSMNIDKLKKVLSD